MKEAGQTTMGSKAVAKMFQIPNRLSDFVPNLTPASANIDSNLFALVTFPEVIPLPD